MNEKCSANCEPTSEPLHKRISYDAGRMMDITIRSFLDGDIPRHVFEWYLDVFHELDCCAKELRAECGVEAVR